MPRRPESYMAERRSQIIDALERCLIRDGWERATLDEVAREAGLSKGAVYGHFRTKRALLKGMLDRDFARLDGSSDSSDLTVFREFLSQSLAPLAQPDGWRVCAGRTQAYIEGARDPEIHADLARSGDQAVSTLASMAQKMVPDLKSEDARVWALGVLVLTNGLAAVRSACLELAKADIDGLIDQHLITLRRLGSDSR
jgi:AcrR family transcriptional regulator